MNQKLKILLVACAAIILSSCGNQSNRRSGNSLGLRGVGGTDYNSSIFTGSGDTGSQNGATSGSTANTATQTATVPQINSNPFARNSLATASEPQQCASVYNSYQRFEGNFERALYDLTTCLNRVMIRQNPTLFQQYQNLYQYQQNPQYGWGIAR